MYVELLVQILQSLQYFSQYDCAWQFRQTLRKILLQHIAAGAQAHKGGYYVQVPSMNKGGQIWQDVGMLELLCC